MQCSILIKNGFKPWVIPAVTVAAVWLCSFSSGQATTNLDEYVQLGLRQNLSLQQQELTVTRANEAAKEARGLLLPSLSVDTRYSDISGNSLDFGDLINPVYSTLNQITGQNRFPTDLSLKLPYKQETSLRLTEPIFQPRAVYNFRMRRDLRNAEQAQLEASARNLAAEIKTAYLNFAKSVRVVELYTQTLDLLQENLRVSQKLVDNQKATLDVLYRARAELSDVQQKLAEAELQRSNAARYFNFLLNRSFDDVIQLDPDSVIGAVAMPSRDSVIRTGLEQREELRQIDDGIRASADNIKINSSAWLPSVALAVDYGFQGQDYRFTGSNDVTTVSLVAQWNLFNGGQDASRRRQAVLDRDRLSLQKDELYRQIELQIRQAYDAALVAQQAEGTARDRLQSAKRSFDLVSRKFSEGMASQVEFLDARTNFTSSGINEILTTYDFVQKYVQLERAAALFEVPAEITRTNR